MGKFSILVLMVAMIASFQNCGKVQQVEMATTSNTPTSLQYNKFSIADYKTYSIWDYQRSQFLDVNLETGEVRVFQEAGNASGPVMWLKDDVLAVAKTTLASAEVCEPVVDISTGEQNCTQMYRYPYAILVNKGDEIRLGEMNNGCDVPVDLCGSKSDEMKQWSSRIVENLENGTVTK